MTTTTTPMMRQYLGIKKDNPDCVLFFRMGDFYEMFGEDAVLAARTLNIALTTRDKNSSNPVPMCGVPFHALDTYLPRMIKEGHKVAICEQTEDPKQAKGIVKREVVRVVTPGAVMEASMLDDATNNFLLSIATGKRGFGLSAVDISTGLFRACQFTGPSALEDLLAEIERTEPKQLLVPDGFEERYPSLARELFISYPKIIDKVEPWTFGVANATATLKKRFGVESLDGFGLSDADLATSSAGAAMSYLADTKNGAIAQVGRIIAHNPTDHMLLDPATVRNLELVKNLIDGGRKGSLLELFDLSVTPMGARQIREWLLRPIITVEKIKARLLTSRAFYENENATTNVRKRLTGMGDLERIAGRIAQPGCSPRDLYNFGESLLRLAPLKEELAGISSPIADTWISSWDDMTDVASFITGAIGNDPPAQIRDGGAIQAGHSKELDELRSIKADSKKALMELEKLERKRSLIPSLKIKYNKIYGYFIEISRRHSDAAPADWLRKQSLVNAERYISPSLKELEEKIVSAEEKAGALEFDLFEAVRAQAAKEIYRAQFMAAVAGAIDGFAALAEVARKNGYVEPEVNDSGVISIEKGRHPIIEQAGLEERFVPNDTTLDTENERLAIITGPNMAGKSTYIRQVALITLLAQAGSFVPAKKAVIGVCDRIFTRVGAQDHLQRGKSTFMVEMNEAANILNNATGKSLVILDEIGRGTSTFDGISIAWAVAEYLHKVGARTLFATHYHELTQLADSLPGVKNLSVSAKEWNDEIIFLRTIAEGGADKSYGIQVARLAGLPQAVIKRAAEILVFYEANEFDDAGHPKLKAKGAEEEVNSQLGIFAPPAPSKVEKELRTIDVDNLTPVEALNILSELKKKLT